MAIINVCCTRCGSDKVYKHGLSVLGAQRYRCRHCRRVFQLSYKYAAKQPGVKDRIVELAMNGSGVRDTARILRIGINTVLRTLKKLSPARVTSSPVAFADVALICELDEQWSYVANKNRSHWLWYAYNTKNGGVLAYVFGPRTDATLKRLLALLSGFTVGMYVTDDWGGYGRVLPRERHLTGKILTQRIERNNLTLRTRIKRLARKTLCFSRSLELHEKVIGTFIERYMFY